MSPLGSVLLQPQMFARLQGRAPLADLADEAVALAQKLAFDPAAQAAVLPAVQAAAEQFGARIALRLETRLPQGLAALRGLLAGPLAMFTALAGGDPGPQALLGRVADLLDQLAGATGALSDDMIRAGVRRVFRLLEKDFGLDPALIGQELQTFVTDLRGGLAAAGPTGHSLGCLLARIQRDLLPAWRPPRVDADRIAGLLIAELHQTGADRVRVQAGCLLTRIALLLRAVAGALRELAAVVVTAPAAPPLGALPQAAAPLRPAPARRSASSLRPAPAGSAPLAQAAAAGAPATVPPRSEDGRYCWYASWLYATRFQGIGGEGIGGGTQFGQTVASAFGYPEDEVWLTRDGKALVLRRASADDELLHAADQPFEWHQAPQFAGTVPVRPVNGSNHEEYFLVKRIGPEFLENFARISAVVLEFAGGLWHVVLMGVGVKEYAVNLPMWLWNWARGVVGSTADAPLPSAIAKAAGWGMGGKYLFAPLVTMLAVFAGSFEGVHTKTTFKNSFLQWLTLLGGDAINTYTVHVATQGLRSLLLSAFTLINYDGPDKPGPFGDTRAKNWDAAAPVIALVNFGITKAFFKVIRREDYGLPTSGDGGPFALWWLVGAPIAAIFGALLGTFTSWAFARTTTPSMLWKEPLKGVILAWLLFLVNMYTNMEGDTDGGRYNPTVDPEGDPITPPRQAFAGYPDAETTPYRLPLAEGGAIYVGQAHQGLFSHMRYNNTPQVYAYDFAHDFKDEILCVRDGTVVDYFDFMPDDTELDFDDPGEFNVALAVALKAQTDGLLTAGQSGFDGVISGKWNFIIVRHDTIDNAHDRDQLGSVVQTYAVYGHGAFSGVRDVFSARGVAPASIVGTPVQRGQVLMLAGDTGVSFHNHLHLHVRGATASTPAAAPVLPGTLTRYTLPFVFRESLARHVFGGNGPLQHLTWYLSQNPKVA